MSDATLGAKLADARKQLGWSLRQAERHSGVPNAHISQIETGAIKRPEAATLVRLADAYDLPRAALMAMAGRQAELAEVQALRDEIERWRTDHNERGADLEGEGKDGATAFARADELAKVLALMDRMEEDS